MDRLMLGKRAIADELMDADDLDTDTYAAVVHDLSSEEHTSELQSR